jgi:hypothetical protein
MTLVIVTIIVIASLIAVLAIFLYLIGVLLPLVGPASRRLSGTCAAERVLARTREPSTAIVLKVGFGQIPRFGDPQDHQAYLFVVVAAILPCARFATTPASVGA